MVFVNMWPLHQSAILQALNPRLQIPSTQIMNPKTQTVGPQPYALNLKPLKHEPQNPNPEA